MELDLSKMDVQEVKALNSDYKSLRSCNTDKEKQEWFINSFKGRGEFMLSKENNLKYGFKILANRFKITETNVCPSVIGMENIVSKDGQNNVMYGKYIPSRAKDKDGNRFGKPFLKKYGVDGKDFAIIKKAFQEKQVLDEVSKVVVKEKE